jgi:hypothetical protein
MPYAPKWEENRKERERGHVWHKLRVKDPVIYLANIINIYLPLFMIFTKFQIYPLLILLHFFRQVIYCVTCG